VASADACVGFGMLPSWFAYLYLVRDHEHTDEPNQAKTEVKSENVFPQYSKFQQAGKTLPPIDIYK
jgi:hypothetical protein